MLHSTNSIFDLIRVVTLETKCLSIEKDLNDKEMKDYFSQIFHFIYDLNQYNIDLEKEKEKWLSI